MARLAENIGFDTETENNLVYILDFVDFFFSLFKLEGLHERVGYSVGGWCIFMTVVCMFVWLLK